MVWSLEEHTMKLQLVGAAITSVFVGLATQSLAQSNADRAADPATRDGGKTFTHGESKRCEGMSGAAKDQCDKEEATKTQGDAAKDAQPAATESARSSTSSAAAGGSFTHGESKRCESLSGADKDQCDKEEATKTQGDAAKDAQPAATESARSSTSSAAAGGTFTHGESKRCESLSGADKDQCDKEEATKTQGDAAREASKSEASK
jgi:hypothetical protein